jgi:DNA helicase-2/ATP-dependent DNA helicase PcrA
VSVATDRTGRYLCALLGKDFTAEQLAVATAPLEPQLVVAGAGSGKTTVMAARLVHAVACDGVAPSSILGLTFTNKAADELAGRVRGALQRLFGPSAAFDEEPVVATYHSYAAGLVRDHALRIGRESMTQLLTEATRWQLAARVVARARDSFAHLPWGLPYVVRLVLALDGEMSEHAVGADDVRRADAELLGALAGRSGGDAEKCREAARARGELLVLVEGYRQAKREADLIDYGDQIGLAAQIAAASQEVRAGERSAYRLVLLDEYQDTGVAQRQLLTSLFGGGHPVTAVGDPHQAIYGWRGASVGNLVRFPEHFPRADGAPAPVLPLMTSFRCGGRILEVANAVAAPLQVPNAEGRTPRLDVPVLSPAPGAEGAGATVVALHPTVVDEAAWLADEIATLLSAGTRPAEVGVLARTRSMFPLLHAALVDRGVPVEVVGLGGLLEMPEVADVVATLHAVADPLANAAVIRLLTGPRWRIGPRDLAALGRRAARLTRAEDERSVDPLAAAAAGTDPVEVTSLVDALDSLGDGAAYSAEALERLVAFRDELRALRAVADRPVVDVVAEVVTRTGLDVEIEAAPVDVAAARAANLAAFADHAASFTAVDGGSDLRSFLAYLAAASDVENGLDPGGVSTADTVKLLTIHKAKGLEWDVVALPGLADKTFPSGKSRAMWTSSGGVLPYSLRGDADDLPGLTAFDSAGFTAFKNGCREDERDEERRLAYVALTRARSTLLASGYWWGETQQRPKGPSSLLLELRALAAQGLVQVGPWVGVDDVAAGNPLRELAARDVAWPRPDVASARTVREAAAERVRAAGRGERPPARLDPADAAVVGEWRDEAVALLVELRRARQVVRDVPLPRRLTASQVVALGDDPDALARQLARPMPARPGGAARRGTRFHAWVEEHYGERPLLDPDDLPGAADADVSDEVLADLQQRFLATPYADRLPVAIEAPFELVVGGRLLRGRIDAVYRTGRGFEVIDFKTGEVPRNFAAASLQLSVYRLAWAELTGVDPRRVDAGFLYVRTGAVKRPERLLDRVELARLLIEGGPP